MAHWRIAAFFVVTSSLYCVGAGWLAELMSVGIPREFDDLIRYEAAIGLIVGASIIIAFGASRYGKEWREQWLRLRYPRAPWMWRADWSQRIARTKAFNVIIPTTVGVGIIMLSLPFVAVAWPLKNSNSLAYLAGVIGGPSLDFLVAAVCVALWWRAWRAPQRALRLLLSPGRPGTHVAYQLRAPKSGDSIRWTGELACVYRHSEAIKESGRYRTEHQTEVLWQQTSPTNVQRNIQGNVLLMRFHPPQSVPPSGAYKRGNVQWTLKVEGTNRENKTLYQRTFDVPFQADQQFTQFFRRTDPVPDYTLPNGSGSPGSDVPAGAEPIAHDEPALPQMMNHFKIIATASGITYADSLWGESGELRLAKFGLLFSGASLALAGLAATAAALFTSFALWAVAIFPLGLGLGLLGWSLYSRFHRFAVTFDFEGCRIAHQLFSLRWQRAVPWEAVQSITVQWTGATREDGTWRHYRRVILNPDDPRTRYALTPSLADLPQSELLLRYFIGANVRFSHRLVEPPPPRSSLAETEEIVLEAPAETSTPIAQPPRELVAEIDA